MNLHGSGGPGGLSAETVAVVYRLAHRTYKAGKYKEAVVLFRTLVWGDGRDWRQWMGYGAALQMLKRFEEAVVAYRRAADLEKGSPHILFHVAECLRAIGRKEEALATLKQAIAAAKAAGKTGLCEQLQFVQSSWGRS